MARIGIFGWGSPERSGWLIGWKASGPVFSAELPGPGWVWRPEQAAEAAQLAWMVGKELQGRGESAHVFAGEF